MRTACLLVCLFAVSCTRAAGAEALRIDLSKLVDLTWDFDENTIYWPTAKGFQWRRDAWGMSAGGYWYASGSYAASEHGGTHLDSPIHFGKGQPSTEQIPVSRLIAPVYVIDVSGACAKDRDYRATKTDILRWEQEHKRIPAGSIVLFRTGWGHFWPDKAHYLGSATPGDISHLHFPGISKDAAQTLVERKVTGVGLDTASLDYGPVKDFITHQVLNRAGIYGLENVAHLEALPAAGATLIALPMKIKGGTGGPVRIVAILP
jgi:kynurenine formamidase